MYTGMLLILPRIMMYIGLYKFLFTACTDQFSTVLKQIKQVIAMIWNSEDVQNLYLNKLPGCASKYTDAVFAVSSFCQSHVFSVCSEVKTYGKIEKGRENNTEQQQQICQSITASLQSMAQRVNKGTLAYSPDINNLFNDMHILNAGLSI